MKPLPQIVRTDRGARFLVDGHPFLILGMQWDCDSCFTAEEMNPLFPHAARIGANTATLPTYWREVEPSPGQYDFRMLDERIRQARANGLRIIPLWFATWKNACGFYAPDYIRNDPATYRLAMNRAGQPLISLCPSCEATWQRDREALVRLMAHLRDTDDQRTVIMIQIENEPGILGSDRCYCPECSARFAAEGWEAEWGEDAAEAFSAASIARYIDRLAGEAKAVYPIPMYINVWLSAPVGALPGREYPAGGAVPQAFGVFRKQLQHVDMIAPDIYSSGYRDFQRFCKAYAVEGNPLYVAEHSSSLSGRAERNVFYALGDFAAIGFDIWAIDSPFPERYGPPMVDPLDGAWAPQAHWLRDSYVAIQRAMRPITQAQGTDRLFTFVQEAGETRIGWAAAGCDVLIRYLDREGAGRGMVIRQGPGEFLMIGVGFEVRFCWPRPSGAPVAIRSAEWGYFDDERWVALHPMRREHLESEGAPLQFLEPGVARIYLDFEKEIP